jgi:hypothetical protein
MQRNAGIVLARGSCGPRIEEQGQRIEAPADDTDAAARPATSGARGWLLDRRPATFE